MGSDRKSAAMETYFFKIASKIGFVKRLMLQ